VATLVGPYDEWSSRIENAHDYLDISGEGDDPTPNG
jgi:hypothetical protein